MSPAPSLRRDRRSATLATWLRTGRSCLAGAGVDPVMRGGTLPDHGLDPTDGAMGQVTSKAHALAHLRGRRVSAPPSRGGSTVMSFRIGDLFHVIHMSEALKPLDAWYD